MAITKGYKATDKDMQCRGLQFVLGEWQSVDGDLAACENGLHFCTELAHTYTFYSSESDRRFECEVDEVLEINTTPGVVDERVARRIKLTKELFAGGDGNTGYRNTGDWNTGDRNTGDRNTGDGNTGDQNTGDSNTGDGNIGGYNTGYRNTGYRNTGDWNTGDWNTGDGNTGYRNTGDWNTGDWNTGDGNTGYRNTGDWNTGDWNHCDRSAGFFNSIDPRVISFDEISEYTYADFVKKFGNLARILGKLMLSDNPIDVTPFATIPNITQNKLNNLHQKFIESRKTS